MTDALLDRGFGPGQSNRCRLAGVALDCPPEPFLRGGPAVAPGHCPVPCRPHHARFGPQLTSSRQPAGERKSLGPGGTQPGAAMGRRRPAHPTERINRVGASIPGQPHGRSLPPRHRFGRPSTCPQPARHRSGVNADRHRRSRHAHSDRRLLCDGADNAHRSGRYVWAVRLRDIGTFGLPDRVRRRRRPDRDPRDQRSRRNRSRREPRLRPASQRPACPAGRGRAARHARPASTTHPRPPRRSATRPSRASWARRAALAYGRMHPRWSLLKNTKTSC